MEMPSTHRYLFRSGAKIPHWLQKFAFLEPDLLISILVIAFAWITQIIFWRIVSWEISFQMNLSGVVLPIGSYFIASVAVTSVRTKANNIWNALLPNWMLAVAWITLTSIFVGISILYRSIALFSLSAALFGMGMYPLLQQAKSFFNSGQPKIALFCATLLGVGVGVFATSGDLFANHHLRDMTLALACCQLIAVIGLQIQNNRLGNSQELKFGHPRTVRYQSLADSLTQAGCGALMAAPIALAPIFKALCGLGLTGFTFGYIAHYCAMLLPSFLDNSSRHTFYNYAVSAAYVISMTFGHIFPLLYLFKADWW
ncbi:hypothetical protein GALL_194940 [mine drainage metagenome]|uniref:Uncharacterized protein n=1 Tax=mine drainage metagenome TaxID=410659 RepID=A0A1J5S2Z5_9ZZZZ